MTVLFVAGLWLARVALGLGVAVLALLALALVVLLLVLVLPFRFSGRWSRPRASPESGVEIDEAAAQWQLHLQWGGPLVQAEAGSGRNGLQVRFLGRAVSQRPQGRGKPRRPPKPARPARPPKAGRRGKGGFSWREWLSRGVLDQGVLLLKRVWHSLHLRVQGDLALGFEDPSLTGLLAAVRAVLPSGLAPDLYLSLDFSRPVLEGWVEAGGHGNLASVVWALILGLFSRPVRRIWMNWLRRSGSRLLRWRPRPLRGRGSLAG